MYPASYGIKKRQMKFWSNLEESISGNSHLNTLIKKAKEMRLPYVMYYMNLQAKYGSAKKSENTLQTEFLSHIQQKIKESYDIDNNSKLGTYYQVNPDLQKPSYPDDVFELHRIHITRFRSGSHNLLIEAGRFSSPRIPREFRICICGNRVQTLQHVLLECAIIAQEKDSFNITFTTVSDFFMWNKVHEYLLILSKVLKIEL